MAGLSEGHDSFVLRGSIEARSFAAFYLREGRLLAADAVNRPGDFMVAKRLVAARSVLDAARLADEAIPLKTLLEPAS
jgi:3-phenylpropionate/trans-cinnamate dioxygenase ferredoxin reductase subunit